MFDIRFKECEINEVDRRDVHVTKENVNNTSNRKGLASNGLVFCDRKYKNQS